MKKNSIRYTVVSLFFIFVLTSCYDFNNPVDPKTGGYIGSPSVDKDGDGVGNYRDVDEISLLSPDDGKSLSLTDFPLVLKTVPMDPALVVKYRVQVSTDTSNWDGSAVFSSETFTGNACTLTGFTAEAGVTYSWRAKAYDGTKWSDAWSSARSFTVSTAAPSNPVPSSAGTVYGLKPLLNWDDLQDASKYEVKIASSEAGLSAAKIIETSASEYAVVDPLHMGDTVYWRVRGVFACGVKGTWSGVWNFTVKSVLTMINVPIGTFSMGSIYGSSDELPITAVTVSAFKIASTEITQGQYQEVMGSNPTQDPGSTAPDKPIFGTNWFDTLVFCNKLSVLEGKTPVYTINGSKDPNVWGPVPIALGTYWDAVTMDMNADGYRLPTEAEWEYAARGGSSWSDGFLYSGSNDINTVAWYLGNAANKKQTVAGKKPNQLGIYDMSGNVMEFCWDVYGSYSGTAQTNPTGPAIGKNRVVRGGEVTQGAEKCTVSVRDTRSQEFKAVMVGFRPVCR